MRVLTDWGGGEQVSPIRTFQVLTLSDYQSEDQVNNTTTNISATLNTHHSPHSRTTPAEYHPNYHMSF